jgi:hypothetical protein
MLDSGVLSAFALPQKVEVRYRAQLVVPDLAHVTWANTL